MNEFKTKSVHNLATKLICIILLIFVSPKLIAQENNKLIEVKSLNKVKLYFFGLALEREQKISRLSTIYIGASVESVVPFLPYQPSGASDVLRLDWSMNFSPVFQLGYKYYYNLDRREKLGKTTKNNSSSFAGLEYNLINPILINHRYTTEYISSFSPIWGFQKSISKNTNIELSAGPSIQTDFSNARVSGFAKFGFTFLI